MFWEQSNFGAHCPPWLRTWDGEFSKRLFSTISEQDSVKALKK